MRIKPEIGSVVGPSDETHWGQAILSPHAYGVVELTCSDVRTRGIELLTTLSDNFKDPPVSLKALERLARSLLTQEINTIILLVPVGNVVYITVAGSGAVYLKRENTISCLLNTSGSVSGQVKAGDTLILASQTMVRAVKQETLVEIFDHLSAQEAAEKLTLLLHEAQNDTGGAALIFQVSEFIPTEEEQKEIPAPAEITKRPMKTVWRFPRVQFRHRKLPIITLFLLALFGMSVVLGVVKKIRDSTSQEVQKAYIEATHVFEEGVALLDLNPVKGRQRLAQAKEILEPFSNEKLVADLYRKVIDNLTLAMHSVRAEPMLFFDPSLIRSGGSVQSMSIFESSFGLFDATNRSIYRLNIAAKKSEVVGGGQLVEGTTSVAAYGDKIYLLTNNGIATVRTSDKKTIAGTIPKSDTWGTISSLVAYGGNLYLLDIQKSRIWKYVATEKNFSELREYLNPDSLPDLSKATGMAIDGSVWIGTSDGKILRFTQGKEQTFLPQGIEPDLGQFLMIYTSDITKNVYILDRDNKRAVVLDKDGMYLAQYLWDGAVNPTQLEVSEKERKVFLLAEGKIYFLELK